MNELDQIIDHFEKYPLITQKCADYELFKQAVEKIKRKEHLTEEGLKKIVAIKASMNNGLSSELKLAFPSIIPVPRPVVEGQKITALRPHWVAGFTTGEGALVVSIAKNAKVTHGLALQPRNYSTNTRLLNNNQKVDQQAPISLFQLDGADKIRRLFLMC
jgi:hypothetical protein